MLLDFTYLGILGLALSRVGVFCVFGAVFPYGSLAKLEKDCLEPTG